MLRPKFLFPLFLTPALAFAQSNYNSVDATASASPQADEAAFSVSVTAGADQSQAQVQALIASAGVTVGDLTGVSVEDAFFINRNAAPQLTWTFNATVPVAKTGSTVSALAALQTTLLQNSNGPSLSFQSEGTQVSNAAAANCQFASLVSSAQAQAQATAAAAGLNAGALLSISGSSSSSIPDCSITARFALGLMLGVTDPNSIRVTAFRNGGSAISQVEVDLTVDSGPDTTQDQVTAALTNAGITGATFSGVDSYTTPANNGSVPEQTGLEWGFSFNVPVAQANSIVTQLATAEKNFPKKNPGLQLFFSAYSYGSATPPLCDQAALVSDAKSLAQILAAAANVTVGPVLSLGNGAAAAAFTGAAYAIFGALQAVQTTAPQNCSLTVQYQLLH